MRHIYLSPHMDDAILSCGGLMHAQRSRNERVTVINLCAGFPNHDQLSPFAKQYHAGWGNLPDVVAIRREEDSILLSRWGVMASYCSTPDSIYRYVGDQVAYPDLAALFGEPRRKR